MSVRDIDKGWKAIIRDFGVLDDAYTKVGLQQGTIRRGTGKEGSSDMVKIAAIQEFGAPKKNIPSRPAIRQAFEMNQKDIKRFSRQIIWRIITEQLTPRVGLGLIGEYHVNQVKKRITDLQNPPNKPGTIKKKKSTNPLIDTGQYRNSITHVEFGV